MAPRSILALVAPLLLASPALSRAEGAPPPPSDAVETAQDPPPTVPVADTTATVTTRAEEWRRLRVEKMGGLQPYRPGFLERNLLAVEKAERPSLLQLNVLGFYPRIQNIASGSQQAIGLRFWQPEIRGSRWDVHGSAFWSRTGYEFYDLQAGMLPHKGKQFPLRSTKGDDVYELGNVGRSRGSHLIAYASLRYRHYPQEDFFGLGADSRKGDQSTFLLQDASYDLIAGYQFTPHLAVTGRAGYLQAFVGVGEEEPFPTIQARFDDAAAPGLRRQPDFLHAGGQLFLDLRDEPGNPHRGGMAALQVTRFDDRGSNAFQFTRFAADVRAYLPLGSPQRVLALRAFTSHDTIDANSRVPFYLQETLGGSHTLRGFRNFRFRGENLLLLQVEYRWEAAPAVELVLFADGGRIAQRGTSLDLEDMDADYGLGVRIKTFNDVLFRFDLARSREDTRVYVRFSPSF